MTKQGLSGLSIEWKLPLIVSSLLLLVTAALFSTAYLRVRSSAFAAASERLQSVASQLATGLQNSARSLERRASTAAADPAVRGYLRSPNSRAAARVALILRTTIPPDSTIVGVEVWDAHGTKVLADGPAVSRIASLPSQDRLSLAGTPETAGVNPLRAIGDTIVYATVAVVKQDTARIGTIVQWRRIMNNARAREQIAKLIGTDAALYVGSPGGTWSDQSSIAAPPPVDLSHASGVVYYDRPGGGRRMAATAVVPGVPWIAVLEFPQRAVLAPVNRFLREMALIAALVIAFGFVGALILSRQITGPLRQLTEAATAMGAGDHTIRVTINRQDELKTLADAFNHMGARVQGEVAARAASEEQWRLLFEMNPHPMWVFDHGTLRFLAVNEAAITLYGYAKDEFLNMTVRHLQPPGTTAALTDQLETPHQAGDVAGTWRHRRKDGRDIDVELVWHTISFAGERAELVLAHDVTAHKALEVQLRQAQKMEAIGRLAGGVAHDFNNLLTAIMSYAELVRTDLGPDDKRVPDVEEIVRAAKQAHGLTRQLLTFSRQQVVQPTTLNPNTIIRDFQRMISRVIGEDIEFALELEQDLGQVRADPGQLEQVLMNLAINGRDAMRGSGGTLTIRTANADLDELDSRLHGVPKGGRYVVITVSDTGVGMSREAQAKIFEPFYTTKAEGTGLGLATVYGIVTQSGGHITVYSEPGQGSTFRVYLPRLEADSNGDETDTGMKMAKGGSETILLVEDDPAVRTVTAEALERQGYKVLAAHTPAEAIALAARRRGPLHLVMTDVVMPGMDGPSLVGQLKAVRPDIKLLFMSGYTGDAVLPDNMQQGGIPFLEKPFTLNNLATKVREAIDA